MKKEKIIAICYDYDKTLAPFESSLNYGFFQEIGLSPDEFWNELNHTRSLMDFDENLGFLFYVLYKAKKYNLELSKEKFKQYAKNAHYFRGVETWFERINNYAKKQGIIVEHYIISSGIKEFIEHTTIAKNFKKIYASTYLYDENGKPIWPAIAINSTNKTQYLYRIKKNAIDIHQNVNKYSKNSRVPFKNMIYIGDSETDIPCMSIMVKNGGTSIGVYEDLPAKKELMLELFKHNRINNYCYADYSENSELEKVVFKTIDKIKAQNNLDEINDELNA